MKSLGQIKEGILRLLWKIEGPLDLRGISEKMGLKARSANMHLLGLRKAGYVSASEDGHYTLTESGKEVIGFPKVDDSLARRVLSKTPPEKAFHFYAGIGQPLGVSSDNLTDFCDKIRWVDIGSVEFHSARGDFELWVHSLGDVELAKRLRLIREENLTGQTLQERLCRVLESRCDELLKRVA